MKILIKGIVAATVVSYQGSVPDDYRVVDYKISDHRYCLLVLKQQSHCRAEYFVSLLDS